jgi:prefoldin subunit 5
MMAKAKGVQPSANEEKLSNLRSQLEEVMSKREELTAEVSTLTTIALKLQGAIEVLSAMEEESEQKKEESSD